MKGILVTQAVFKDPSEKIGLGCGRALRHWNKDIPLPSAVNKSLQGLGENMSTKVPVLHVGSFLAINHGQVD